MATQTLYGANYTIEDNSYPGQAVVSGTAVDGYLRSSQWQGKVRCISDIITNGTAAADAGSLLYIGKLPIGAIPIAVMLCSDTTNAITGTVGYTGDTNALGQFATLANSLTTANAAVNLCDTSNTPLAAAQDVFITTADAALEASKIVHAKILYAVE